MKTRHSILIITYNQQELISKCLDSILSQSETPYEIVICEDNSSDNTWSVIQRYVEQYPTLIKAYHNETNLGVFGNVNKIKQLASGDFINFVSGDDMLPQGALKAYSQFIAEHKLDCLEPFVIFSDCIILSGDKQRIISNHRNMTRYDVFENIVLGCLWSWDTGLSRGLLDAMEPLNTQIGYQADLLWNLDKVSKALNHYYVQTPGYIYRANVGVTANTKLQQHIESKKRVFQLIDQIYQDKITTKLRTYMNFDMAWNEYRLNHTCKNYLRFIWCYIIADKFRYNNQYRNNYKILIPIGLKGIIKKIGSK